MDSAYFRNEYKQALEQAAVSDIIGAPPERLLALKEMLEAQVNWARIGESCDSFHRT